MDTIWWLPIGTLILGLIMAGIGKLLERAYKRRYGK